MPAISQFCYPGIQLSRDAPPTQNLSRLHRLAGEAGEPHMHSETFPQFPIDEGLLGDIVPPGMRNIWQTNYEVQFLFTSIYLGNNRYTSNKNPEEMRKYIYFVYP